MKYLFNLKIILFTCIGIASCSTIKNNTHDAPENFNNHPSYYQSDFTGFGSDSTWKLSVRFENELVFTSLQDGIEIRCVIEKELVAQGANNIKIVANLNGNQIRVTIDNSVCDPNTYKVSIEVKNQSTEKINTYEGCGKYNGAPKLFDIWALESIDGKPIDQTAFRKQIPYLEINLMESTFAGFGGCNEFSGNLNFSYNKINFGPIAATKMYCAQESETEFKLFNFYNSGAINYLVKGTNLVLETAEGSFTFKKVD